MLLHLKMNNIHLLFYVIRLHISIVQAQTQCPVHRLKYKFEMKARSTGYVSFGLSRDKSMGGDLTTNCIIKVTRMRFRSVQRVPKNVCAAMKIRDENWFIDNQFIKRLSKSGVALKILDVAPREG